MVEVKKNIVADLSVGEVARRAGVTVAALHFYERQSLIKSIRTSGNQRRYPRAILRRVALIQVAKGVGMPLSELAVMLNALPNGRTPNLRDWSKIATSWRKEIEQRISRLEKLKQNLAGCIGCGCLILKRCRLFNSEDHLAKKGPGAVRLKA